MPGCLFKEIQYVYCSYATTYLFCFNWTVFSVPTDQNRFEEDVSYFVLFLHSILWLLRAFHCVRFYGHTPVLYCTIVIQSSSHKVLIYLFVATHYGFLVTHSILITYAQPGYAFGCIGCVCVCVCVAVLDRIQILFWLGRTYIYLII